MTNITFSIAGRTIPAKTSSAVSQEIERAIKACEMLGVDVEISVRPIVWDAQEALEDGVTVRSVAPRAARRSPLPSIDVEALRAAMRSKKFTAAQWAREKGLAYHRVRHAIDNLRG